MSSKVVHVGLHKTGTTSLQDSYFPFVAKVQSYKYNPPKLVDAIHKGYVKGFANCVKEKELIREYLNSNDWCFVNIVYCYLEQKRLRTKLVIK